MERMRGRVGRATFRAARALPRPLAERLQAFIGGHQLAGRVAKRLTDPMREGVHVIARGPAQGLSMDVAGSRPSYVLGTAEPDVTRFLEQHIGTGDVVFDLGANVGYFTLVVATLTGPTGRVIAVEPLPSNVEALRRNVALNDLDHVTIVEAAVSADEGTAALTVADSDQAASLVLEDRGPSTITVPTVTIDGLAHRFGVEPALVKMDVEGAEEDVVKGGAETLAGSRPVILCELHIEHPSFESPVPKALADSGYEVSWLERAAYEQDVFWAPHLVARPVETNP